MITRITPNTSDAATTAAVRAPVLRLSGYVHHLVLPDNVIAADEYVPASSRLTRNGVTSKTWHVPAPSDDALPFPLLDDWPIALPGCVVTMRETGVALGSLLLEDEEWRAMRSTPVFSLRIDDHPILDGWATRLSDGTESSVEFDIPLNPVVVPAQALADCRAFSEWVMDTHGAGGRLLLWDEVQRWWIAQEADLELALTCAPPGVFASTSEAPSWLAFGSATGRQAVDELCARYGVTWVK